MTAVADKDTARPAPRRRSLLRRAWSLAWKVVLVLVLLPLVLVPVYRVVPPVSTLMVWDFATGQGVDRRWVALDDVAPSLVAAVLMSEDGRFCTHRGVDWEEMAKVIEESDDRPRGASTITMQTVKNLFLWQSRSYVRKALEIPLALYADFIWGKPRTMELYLNVADWGPGIFGAEAAAQHYFGKPAADLTLQQSALLAAALPNPELRDPGAPTRNLNRIANRVAARAQQAGDYVGCLAP